MSKRVVCPNCGAVTPPWRYCAACNAFLGNLLDIVVARERTRPPDMDTHLAKQLRRTQRPDIHRLPISTGGRTEIAVIAEVKDLAAFTSLIETGRVALIHPISTDESGQVREALVTARIPADQQSLEKIRRHASVGRLKAARRVRPMLERATEDVLGEAARPTEGVEQEVLIAPKDTGRGVIVGIIDFGIDFVHMNFRNSDRTTRILALWDQRSMAQSVAGPRPFNYGRLILSDEINRALGAPDPYTALSYTPSKDSIHGIGSHGTYVADVAAGNGLGTKCPGMAPEADIVFVDLSMADTPSGPTTVGSTFGDSAQLLEAIRFIFSFAKERELPCVINISLGTNGGPHDGTTLLEEAVDRLVSDEPNRAVVIAAGNSGREAIHAEGKMPRKGTVDLKWKLPRFDSTSNEVEVWYSKNDRFSIELIDPAGNSVTTGPVQPGHTWESGVDSAGLIMIVNHVGGPAEGGNTIGLFFECGVQSGEWILRLRGDLVQDGGFHAWIERDEYGQSRFIETADPSWKITEKYTMSSIACGHKTIVVGSYDAYDSNLAPSESSSSGPTRDERQKPDISAPGERVLAALSDSVAVRYRNSGTSMAAAVVTGTVALMLEAATTRGVSLTADQILEILIKTARSDRRHGWNEKLGHGRISARAAVAAISNTSQAL